MLFWLANEQKGLDIFRRGEDIYNDMATTIYGYPVNRELPEHDKQGKLGKVAILGLGFQMGASKFVETAEVMGGVTIVEDLSCLHCGLFPKADHHKHEFEAADPDEMTAVKVVQAYREKYWRVKQLWWDTEKAAVQAVQRPGKTAVCGKVSWIADDDFLYCILPSGRRLGYPEPAIQQRATPWGDRKPSLTFKGINPFNRKWMRQHTYGGSLVENATQAVARDLLAAAMLRCEKSGVYAPILSVHDEILAEADEGAGDVAEFEHLMATIPKWAQGLPVKAKGWNGKRYRK